MEIFLSVPIILLNLASPFIYVELISGYIRIWGAALFYLIILGFLSAIVGLLIGTSLGFIIAASAAINLFSPLAILIFQAQRRTRRKTLYSNHSPEKERFRDPFSLL